MISGPLAPTPGEPLSSSLWYSHICGANVPPNPVGRSNTMEVQLTMVVAVEDLPEIGEALRPARSASRQSCTPPQRTPASSSTTLADVLSPSPTLDSDNELEWVATAFLDAIPKRRSSPLGLRPGRPRTHPRPTPTKTSARAPTCRTTGSVTVTTGWGHRCSRSESGRGRLTDRSRWSRSAAKAGRTRTVTG